MAAISISAPSQAMVPVITREVAEVVFGVGRESLMTMRGRKVWLRPATEGDVAAAMTMHCRPERRLWVGSGGPLSVAAAHQWLRARLEIGRGFFAVHHIAYGRAVGFTWFDMTDDGRSALITAGLSELRGVGIGIEAGLLATQWAFQREGLHRLSAAVAESNHLSRRAVLRCGAKLEGRIREQAFIGGRYVDILMYGLLATEAAAYLPEA